MELIDKEKVLKEVQKVYDEGYKFLPSGLVESVDEFKDELLRVIDTLEVKEVNLEKEIALVKGDYEQVDVAWNNDFDFIARHFFELGLNSKK